MKEEYNEQTQQLTIECPKVSEKILKYFSKGVFLCKYFKADTARTPKIVRYFKRALFFVEEGIGVRARKLLFRKTDIVSNRIVMATYQENYSCNCKYLADRILEKNIDYQIIFIVSKDVFDNKDKYEVPNKIMLVQRNTVDSFYALASAHYWFDNALNCIWKEVPKKTGQIYINLWHGSLGIKKLSGNKRWRWKAKYGNEVIDYFATDSIFDEEVFSKSYWPKCKFLKVGHPRNDIFFDKNKVGDMRKKVCETYNISPNMKIALYAPTFRDNKSDVSAINIDTELLRKTLEERFGGQWVILARLHFHNINNEETRNHFAKQNVIDASMYLDMQELMAASDVGITDYSSWIFDFLFTGKPAFIYAEDIEKYINSRGFYYSLEETPFLIADSNNKLRENILKFSESKFEEETEKFLGDKGCYEKGKACDGIIEFIESED